MREGRLQLCKHSAWALVCLCWIGMALAGCRRASRDAQPPPPSDWVCLLDPAVSNQWTQAAVDCVRGVFPEAPRLAPEEAVMALRAATFAPRVLIVPAPRFIPVEWWAPLETYLKQGGAAVFLGTDPFEERLMQVGDAYMSGEEYRVSLAGQARVLPGFSAVEEWRHHNERGRAPGSVRKAPLAEVGWPAVLVEVDGLELWDAIECEEVPRGVGRDQANALLFYARGDARTTQLIIECLSDDGRHWYAQVPLGNEWRLYEVRAESFVSKTPGETAFELGRLLRMRAGLFMEHAPQARGPHLYGLSDIRVVHDPRLIEKVAGWPDILLLSPPERYYTMEARRITLLEEKNVRPLPVGNARLQSPHPQPRGIGGALSNAWRWIPLAAADDLEPHPRGWPASVVFSLQPTGVLQRCGWVGLDPTGPQARAAATLLAACVRRLAHGPFLLSAGCAQSAFEPGESILVGASWVEAGGVASVVRIVAELVEPDGSVSRRVVSAPRAFGEPVEVNLGAVPGGIPVAADKTVRISLQDTRIVGRTYDTIEQRIKFLPALEGRLVNRLDVAGSAFRFMHKPAFLFALWYRPASTLPHGPPPGEYAGWLASGRFDLDEVSRDLKRIREMGFNTVCVSVGADLARSQLPVFLEEAARQDLWVLIEPTCFNPLDPDWPWLDALIQQAGLKQAPRAALLMFSVDAALQDAASLWRYNRAWKQWLANRLGSLSAARQLINPDAHLPEEALADVSGHDPAHQNPGALSAAFYRRFWNDRVSAALRDLRNHLRQAGVESLVGLRGSSAADWMWQSPEMGLDDPAAAVVHLDYAILNAWPYAGRQQTAAMNWLTAYVRGMSGSKPVVWDGLGVNFGSHPHPGDLEMQAGYFSMMLPQALSNQAAACIVRAYAPGCPGRELAGDGGLLNPDGTWRPAALVCRQFAHAIRQHAPSMAGPVLTVELPDSSAGVGALWRAWTSSLQAAGTNPAPREIRLAAWNQPSTTLPSPSGLATNDLPTFYTLLNAEWLRVEISKTSRAISNNALQVEVPVRVVLQLLNSGVMAWAGRPDPQSGTVWLQVTRPQGQRDYVRVDDTPVGRTASIPLYLADPGQWTVRPFLWDAAGFGDPLLIQAASRATNNLAPR